MNENEMVVKSNKLIESKGKMTLLEQKLFAACVSSIKKEDIDFKPIELDLREFQRLSRVSGNAFYEQIEEAANTLMDKKIRIEDEEGNVLITRYLSSAKYKRGTANIVLKFDPNLKPYLLELKAFTRYQLKNVLTLNSNYSFKIYELLKQYQNMKGSTRIVELVELREYLGIEEHEYSRFSNFRTRVLDTSKNEINKKTDLIINYETIRENRKITQIKFTIKKKYNEEQIEYENYKLLINSITDDNKFKQDKEKCGLENKKIDKTEFYKALDIAIEKESENAYEYMALTVDYVEKRNPRHFESYLKSALKKNYINY